MKKIVTTIAIACLTLTTAFAQKSRHTEALAQYVYPENVTARPDNLVYLPDGTSYAMLSEDGRRIVAYDIKTGKETSTLFDVSTAREVKLDAIDGFTISDNASKILVWCNSKPIYRRSSTAVHYVYECRSRLLRPLSANHSRQRSPIFSPDGRMVAFVAEDNNIYIYKWDYKTEVAVTTDGKINEVINGVPDWTYEEEFATTCSMAWAPDNLGFCYLKYNESHVPMYSFPLYEGSCNPQKQYALYPGAFTYKYPVAGERNSTVSLHSYDIETRKTKDIDLPWAEAEYIPRIAYTPSEDMLMVAVLNRNQNQLHFYAVNPKSTIAKSIYHEESKAWIDPLTYENFHIGTDGFTVISAKSGYNQLYKYSFAGAMVKQLTSGNTDVTDYYGSDAKGCHYYQTASPTPMDRTIYKIDAKGAISPVSKTAGTSSATFSPSCEYFVQSFSDVDTPPVFSLCNSQGKQLRVLEDNGEYKTRYSSVAKKEFFTFQSDGNTLNGFMIKPEGFSPSKKYPVIMYQYSGPGSQEVLNIWRMDWYYYFAKQGYLIVCVDGRGTGGRGRAFSDAVYCDLGHYETIDQINAARYVGSLPYADASRIGIFGWSYGGYETLMAASAENAPYAAAVAVAPVTDWRYYDTVYAERYMLTPQQNEDGYRTSAPINRAGSLKCPLLIMHGTADDNVHLLNTMQYVSALQAAGCLCDMWLFPNMNHSIMGCNARTMVYAKMLDYFNKTLK